MKTFRLNHLVALAAVWVGIGSAAEVQMQAERVALFKNGYACVQMQGKLGEGAAHRLSNIPLPVHGTFWWQAPVDVARMEGRLREVETTAADFEQYELLLANEGKCVIVELKNDKVYQGIVSLPSAPQGEGGSFCTQAKPDRQSQPMLVINTFQGTSICLDVNDVRSIEFPGSEQPVLPTRKLKLAELDMQLAKPAPGGEMQLSCLTYGMSWLPTYSLHLGEGGQATLACRATVINDLVDLEHVQLDLVSGAPALGKALAPSVLAHVGNMAQLLQQLGDEKSEDTDRQPLMSNMRVDTDFNNKMEVNCFIASAERLSRAEDLFYYRLPDFTCKRGETVMKPIFTYTVPYKDVYTCAVPNQRELANRTGAGKPVAEIYHCIRLTNTGELPWSTGIVTCMSGGKLVARGTLNFALAGQESLLRLTETLDVSAACREQLVQKGRRRTGNNSGEPSTYRGELILRNKSDKPMDIELSKAVLGAVSEATDEGEIHISPAYSNNATSTIKWKFRLEPGAEKTVGYTYRYQE